MRSVPRPDRAREHAQRRRLPEVSPRRGGREGEYRASRGVHAARPSNRPRVAVEMLGLRRGRRGLGSDGDAAQVKT